MGLRSISSMMDLQPAPTPSDRTKKKTFMPRAPSTRSISLPHLPLSTKSSNVHPASFLSFYQTTLEMFDFGKNGLRQYCVAIWVGV